MAKKSISRATKVIKEQWWINPVKKHPDIHFFGREQFKKAASRQYPQLPKKPSLYLFYLAAGIINILFKGRPYLISQRTLVVLQVDNPPEEIELYAYNGSIIYHLGLDFPNHASRQFLDFSADQARFVTEEINGFQYAVRRGNDFMLQCYENLLEAFEVGTAVDDALYRLSLRTNVMALLEQVIRQKHRSPEKKMVSKKIEKAKTIMRQNVKKPLSIAAVARKVGMGTNSFNKEFVAQASMTPGNFYKRARIVQVLEAIRKTEDSLETIAHQFGFSSSFSMSRTCQTVTGKRPSYFRENIL